MNVLLKGRTGRLQSVDLLVPELFAADGGIQVYSRTLICALRTLRPHLQLRVFCRNDHPHHLPESEWEGIEWHLAAGSRRRFVRDLLQATRRRRPQLLFSTHVHFALLLCLHHRVTGVPGWCSAHGIEVWDLARGPSCWALGCLQRLLPVSRFTAERLQDQLGGRCPVMSLLPNSFDAGRFTPNNPPISLMRRYGLQPDQPLIVSLSRLSTQDRYKHLDRLIEALPPLLTRWSGLRLLIAGDGELRFSLQALAASLGVAHAVIFTGRVGETELVDHLRLASVFALPSSGEGFGIVFLEALACGLPVLAGDCDGSCDPLADGVHGLLVDPHLPLAPPLMALLEGRGEPLWFDPSRLSAAVERAFGFEAFCSRLDTLLNQLEDDLPCAA